MHRFTNNRQLWGWAALLAGIGLLLFSLAGTALRAVRRHLLVPLYVDNATLPPRQAFEVVFGQPAPPGVTEILSAGVPQGGFVWMRLRATDPAIRVMTGGKQPNVKSIGGGVASLLHWPEPPGRVHWEGVSRIRRPECYKTQVGSNPVDSLIRIVDWQRHLVYGLRHFQ